MKMQVGDLARIRATGHAHPGRQQDTVCIVLDNQDGDGSLWSVLWKGRVLQLPASILEPIDPCKRAQDVV